MEQEIKKSESVYVKLGVTMLGVTFGALALWASIAPLNSAVVSMGKLAVSGKNKTVQHLDGGRVSKLHVKEGDLVYEGQLLLQIDTDSLMIQKEMMQEKFIETQAVMERIKAELSGENDLEFSDDLKSVVTTHSFESILETQKKLFESRKDTQRANMASLKQRLVQSQKQIDGAYKQIEMLKKRAALIKEDLAAMQELAKEKLVSDMQVRDIQKSLSDVEGQIVSLKSEISRLEEVKSESDFRLASGDKTYMAELLSEQQGIQGKQVELLANLKSIQEEISRTQIRSPINGKVKGLDISTVGAVVTPGQSIMEIVPSNSTFSVEARISPSDIEVTHVGMSAEVRLSSIDNAQLMPALFAKVVDVSSDDFEDERQQGSYYKATLELDVNTANILQDYQVQLVSGMPAEVLIIRGQQTMLDYLLRPLSKTFNKAFNEG